MRFQVPQFIEVEDKIFGPLTLKQFIYVAGGGGLSITIFLFLPWYIAFIFIAVVLALSLSLAFYKINNKPFIFTVEAAVKYFFNSKLYVWKKEDPIMTPQQLQKKVEANLNPLGFIPKLANASKLNDLTWDLATKKDSLNPASRESGQTSM